MKPAAAQSRKERLRQLRDEGLAGYELVRRHAALVDQALEERFRQQKVPDGVTLIALGGYGRRELSPYSDIDILLLYESGAAAVMEELTSALLYPLWDAGYEVGHSVRTVDEALDFAAEDFIFQVALLDARLLAGNRALFDTMVRRYREELLDHRRMDFARTLEDMRQQRWQRFGGHGYLLEPQLKEGRGGLRDFQSILWLARAVFGINCAEELVNEGLLRTDEQTELLQAWEGLLDLRNRLHWLSGRKNDQLSFEYQVELARELGFAEDGEILAVEHFMRRIYSQMHSVAVVGDLLFEHVRDLQPVDAGEAERQLEEGLVLRRGRLHLLRPEDLAGRKQLLMRLFFHAAQLDAPLHQRTWRMIRGILPLVDARFRSSRRVARSFLELLHTTPAPATALEAMLATGFLAAYLPEFAHIEALPQHDLYHIYTVDRHQLQTVTELTLLRQETPELFQPPTESALLFLAALLHDIGKGRGGNHSHRGAELSHAIAVRLGLDKGRQETLAFLIQHHLLLPETALRRDLEDQNVLASLARVIGSSDRLTMLYLLSMADSRATGPQAWTPWKASLMGELFWRVKARLEQGLPAGVHPEAVPLPPRAQGVEWLRQQVLELLAQRQELTGMTELARMLPAEYLLGNTPEAVLHHLEIRRREATRLAQQHVLLFPQPAAEGHWNLLLMSRDRTGLLAKFCGVLSLHNLNVLAAQIATWPDATVVDIIDVAPLNGVEPHDEDWIALERDLNLAVSYRLDLGFRLQRKRSHWHRHNGRRVQRIDFKVLVDNSPAQRQTVIEVHGADRPAALYQLAQIIADMGLNIAMAKIATEVEQLIDVFYVTERDGGKLIDPERQEELRRMILGIWQEEG
ncbi:MAG: [protein-PII] uridylyltransferase [Desulfobulbaceae bacterium A2]|nr:MAG: [protein-PII] uridylyltransferase [Desulfobulbaceae bacterium A2]